MPVRLLLAVMVAMQFSPRAWGQPAEEESPGAKAGQTRTERWRFGMIITASGGPCTGLVGTVTVPMDWPGLQEVREVSQDLAPGAKVQYKVVDGTTRQMSARIPKVGAGQQAQAVVTFEIKRTLAAAPEQTGGFVVPDAKTLDRAMHVFLAPSPYIESTHAKIQEYAKQVGADKQKAWDRVEAIYDWVRDKVQYRKNTPPKSTLQTLQDGFGDCDEMCSLFIAICRAGGIPARTVRIPGHVYAEFYLLDDKGRGQWFPCQLAGTRAFGEIPQGEPILQRGDNYRASVLDPQTKKPKIETYRYLPDTLVGVPRPGGGQPQMKLVCERVREDDRPSEK
jgi:hypothetical protein